eukprot:Tamp_12016.p1 GENE.Tamp_12016~~Tamp_12016.p1  ORF type:complete len:426 (+),score=75.11 Tamp_12016:241-1518(+)
MWSRPRCPAMLLAALALGLLAVAPATSLSHPRGASAPAAFACGARLLPVARQPWQVPRRQRRAPATVGIAMRTRKALCGLWALQFTIEDEQREERVWLEEGGNMRPVRTAHPHLAPDADPPSANVPAPPMLLSKGRWSVKQSSVLLYHRRVGELSHSWSGQVLEQQLGNETANISRTIVDGIIQQGDSDAEFLGSFQAQQILAAYTPEELLEDEFAHQRSPVPRYTMDHMIGTQWRLRGNIYDQNLAMDALRMHEDGSFEFCPVEGYRFGGRWGLYRDGPEEELEENREKAEKQKGSRRQGTHFWLWAQRGECRGIHMNADYRFLGRIKAFGLDSEVRLSIAKKAAEAGGARTLSQGGALVGEGQSSQGAGEDDGYEVPGEFAAPSNMRVCIDGMVFWGNIADMEYSDLAGKFSLTPILPEEQDE